MKALVMRADGVRVEDRPEPVPGPGEALLAVEAAGICSTDLEIARGYMQYRGVLGHEVVARVLEGPEAWRGQRVAVEINCSCHVCPTCAEGHARHCPTRTVLGILGKDGGLAERLTAPLLNLHRLPDDLDARRAVFVEPLAAAVHAFDDAHVPPGARVLVIGDGKLGLLIGLALAQRHDLAEAVLLGRHAHKRALVAAAGLTTHDRAAELPSGHFDVVIEATGQADGLTLALRVTRPRGTIVLKSTYAGGATLDLAPVVIHELRVVGSRCGSFPRAIDALARGRVDPTPLIAAEYSLADGEAAFAHAGSPGVLKVIVRP
jgi:threonine dehydrogenase-like Zn-dependent dehydrogenase